MAEIPEEIQIQMIANVKIIEILLVLTSDPDIEVISIAYNTPDLGWSMNNIRTIDSNVYFMQEKNIITMGFGLLDPKKTDKRDIIGAIGTIEFPMESIRQFRFLKKGDNVFVGHINLSNDRTISFTISFKNLDKKKRQTYLNSFKNVKEKFPDYIFFE